MAKFDFFSKSYTLEEIIDGYTGGSLENFKDDQEFLDFLISFTVGNSLQGPDADKYKEYANYEGVLSISVLDQYDMLGETLYKIYEICNKDKLKFIRTCHHIGEYTIKHTFSKEAIETNLKLSHPVDFVDDSIVLSDGTTPVYDYNNPLRTDHYSLRGPGKPYGLDREYDWELERSLRRRINDSIKENGDDIAPLEEMVSYIENKRIEEEKEAAKKVKDDHVININNIYFGKETMDISGGVLGMHIDVVSWFEDTNISMMNYRIFRSVPAGDYCLLDNEGNIHIPNEILTQGNISVEPNTAIRKVEIASLPKLFEATIEKLEEESENAEETILNLKGIQEMLEIKENISVEELKEYESVARVMYENTIGELFKSDRDQNQNMSGTPKK